MCVSGVPTVDTELLEKEESKEGERKMEQLEVQWCH